MSDESLRLDPDGFSGCAYKDGRVRLELRFENREGLDDPLCVWMSPGQAMDLIEKISRAARLALKVQFDA